MYEKPSTKYDNDKVTIAAYPLKISLLAQRRIVVMS